MPKMRSSRAPWYAAGITALLTSIGSAIAGYYASGAGSAAPQIDDLQKFYRELEHRVTVLEGSDHTLTVRMDENYKQDDRVIAKQTQDELDLKGYLHDLWFSISSKEDKQP